MHPNEWSYAIRALCEKEVSEVIKQEMWLIPDGKGSYIPHLEIVVLEKNSEFGIKAYAKFGL